MTLSAILTMMSTADTLELIHTMRNQEVNGYRKVDWLEMHQKDCVSCSMEAQWSSSPLHHEPVDLECREKMILWCIQVIEFCKFKRETVEIAVSLLDRFMATREASEARSVRGKFQLACMASLYTAIKVHEPTAMDPGLVSKLSRGAFSGKDIERMEGIILGALTWRVNPPTSLSFVYLLADLIPPPLINDEIRATALELAQFQTELAVCRHELIAVPAATLALATVVNSLESLQVDPATINSVRCVFSRSLDYDDDSVNYVQGVLYSAVMQHPMDMARQSTAATSNLSRAASTNEKRMTGHSSPRAITTAQ